MRKRLSSIRFLRTKASSLGKNILSTRLVLPPTSHAILYLLGRKVNFRTEAGDQGNPCTTNPLLLE